MTVTGISHETRLIDRRCRCGKLAAEPRKECEWHAHGSAQYAADLLAYIDFHRRPTKRTFGARLMSFATKLFRGDHVNLYLFEYTEDGRTEQAEVCSVDSEDAFNSFRIDHPSVPISNIWVKPFGAK
jgi:hypothetical protein